MKKYLYFPLIVASLITLLMAYQNCGVKSGAIAKKTYSNPGQSFSDVDTGPIFSEITFAQSSFTLQMDTPFSVKLSKNDDAIHSVIFRLALEQPTGTTEEILNTCLLSALPITVEVPADEYSPIISLPVELQHSACTGITHFFLELEDWETGHVEQVKVRLEKNP